MKRLWSYLLLAAVPALVACEALQEPENIDISIDAPSPVSPDAEFDIVITLTNTAAEPQTLVDLDIADEWLDGVMVRSMSPPFSGAEHIPFDNTQSYSLDLVLPPGQEVRVVVRAQAVHPGDWRGDFDFCINSAVSYVSYPVRTIVR